MPRVLLASLAQETCSFVPSRHTLEDFRRYYLYTGQEIIDKLRGGGMEIAGIIEVAEEEGVELVPVLATYGGTGGPVQSAAYKHLRGEILAGARRHADAVDGAILALHGAMLTEDLDDPEGDLLTGLREVLGPTKPIVCSLDLHAHVTDLMVRQATALVAYQTHPHVDFRDTGVRAMRLLARVLRGEIRPVMAHRKLPMIAPPEQHNTSRPPMGPIMQRVKAVEKEDGMLAAAIFPVQPQLDIPNLGWSVIAVADGQPDLARARADEIADLAWQHRRDFLHRRTPVPDALRIARETPGGPDRPGRFQRRHRRRGGRRQYDSSAGLAGVAGARPVPLAGDRPRSGRPLCSGGCGGGAVPRGRREADSCLLSTCACHG